MWRSLFIVLFLVSTSATAATFPKVDADISDYDKTVAQMKSDFGKIPPDPNDKTWVREKLLFMFQVDQYMRLFPQVIFKNSYSADEEAYFWSQFVPRWKVVDEENTSNIKALLKIYDWFRISIFGADADLNAWLLVQHADHDTEFQKEILLVLEKLYPIGETKPGHYAYLFDRIAASWHDPSKRTLQRYGTQGQCVGPGQWEPIPIEDPTNVDSRRAAMGMESMADYKARFKDICR